MYKSYSINHFSIHVKHYFTPQDYNKKMLKNNETDCKSN